MTAAPAGNAIVIIGAGGHAKVVADIARRMGFLVEGFIDTVNLARRGELFAGSRVLGGFDELGPMLQRGIRLAAVAFGECKARLDMASRLTAAGFELPVLAHPSAVVAADVTAGAGTVIVAGAIVNPGSTIGRAVIVNTAASIDHDCVVGDGAHIAVGARVAGHVSIGRAAWIGMGALVRDGISVGAGTIVGAGAVVLKDLPDGVTAYGVPAKVVSGVSSHDLTR